MISQEEIYRIWRKCEHIAHSGLKEWRFDDTGHPMRYCDYLKTDKDGGWFIEEDENHHLRAFSYQNLRSLL